MHLPVQSSKISRAFTLMELLVVMGIMVILLALTVPALKSMVKSNGEVQAINVIRSYLASARSIAISQHRQAGVVFFEESPSNNFSSPVHAGQTAMQLIVEDPNQTQYSPQVNNTVFIQYSTDREYLPPAMQVATLNDTTPLTTGDNASGSQTRVILFNANGQMILRDGVARPIVGSGTAGTYPRACGDWNLISPGTAAPGSVSSPGLIVFNMNDYKNEAGSTDPLKINWIQQHAKIIVVNAYTGGIIQ